MKHFTILFALIALAWIPQVQAKLSFYKCYVQAVGGDRAVVDVAINDNKDSVHAAARAAIKKGVKYPQKEPLAITQVYQCVERGKVFANIEARELDSKKIR